MIHRIVALTLAMASAAQAQQPAADTLARIDSLFRRISADAPGCALGVGRDGAPNIERSYGMASLEYQVPISAATIFHVGSIAKQFTAAAVIRLAQAGKLSLDDDIRRHVPELPDYGAKITLRQLMQHTSGLRDQGELMWLAGGRDDDPTEEEDVLAPIFRQKRLNFPPGTQHVYNNSGYSLLALVVRRVSGKSLKEIAAEQLFVPLGMRGTQFVDSRFAVIPRRATGYRMVRGGRWGHVAYLSDAYGPGGLFTTVGDLIRWYTELPRHPALFDALQRRTVLADGDSVPYAAGLELGLFRGARYIAHGGNALGENAYAMRFVDRGLTVAVLCNGREIDAFTYARQTAGLFISPMTAAAAAPADSAPIVALSAAQVRKFTGIYYNPVTLATRTVQEKDGRLFWVRGGPGTPLDPVAPNRFRFPPGTPVQLLFPDARRGEAQELQVLSLGTVTSYRRAAPFVSNRRPNEYAGRFRSEEVDVTLTVTQADSAIVVSTPGSWSHRAEPLFRDAFAIPEAAVFEFVRRNGRVIGMIVDMSRSRRMRFVKLP